MKTFTRKLNRLVIEVHHGLVSGVYWEGNVATGKAPAVFVVDLDGAEVGESTAAEAVAISPLDQASDIIQEAL